MPSHQKALSVFLIFAFLPFIPLIAQSSEINSATKLEPGFIIVADFAGDPKLIEKEGDDPRPLQKGEKIQPSTSIRSGAGERVDLAMSNGALVQLLDNSQLSISEFLQDPCKFVFSDGIFSLTQEIDNLENSTSPNQPVEATTEAWNKLSTEPSLSKCKLLLNEGTIVGYSKKLRPGSKLEIVTPIGTADIRGTTWRTTVTPTDKSNEFRGVIQITDGSIFFTKPDGTGSVSIAAGYSLQFSAKVADQGNVIFYALSATPMSPESIQTLLTMVSEVESKQTYFKLGRGPNGSFLASATETTPPNLNGAPPDPKTDQDLQDQPPTPSKQEKLASDEKPASSPLTTPDEEESKPVAEQAPSPLEPTKLPQPTTEQVLESPVTKPHEQEKLASKEPAAPPPSPTSLNEDLASLSPQARGLADLGSQLYKDKRFFDSVIIYRRALKMEPENLFLIAHVAIAKIQVGKISDARVGLEKVLLKKPKDLLVLTNLAIVYSRLKAYDKAIATLEQILEIDPQNALAIHDMGVALGKAGKLKESEDHLLRSIALDPDYGQAHLDLALVYLQQNPPALDLARASYEKAKCLGCSPDSKIEGRLNSP